MNLEGVYPRKPRKQIKKSSPLYSVALVLFIFAVLAALCVPNVSSGHGTTGKFSAAKADIAELTSAIDQFKLDCGRYPTTSEGLPALRIQPAQAPGWRGPYIKQHIPPDPWNNPYRYTSPGPSGHGYQVLSCAADGLLGGEGDNADIVGGSGN